VNQTYNPLSRTPQLLAESSATNATLNARYSSGPGGYQQRQTTATTNNYLLDPQGSVLGTVDNAQGIVTGTNSYDPFGNPRFGTQAGAPTGTPAAGNPLQYIGGYHDPSTGLYNLGARQYDTKAGRFLAKDPLAPIVSNPSESTYAYSRNNPIAFADPTGMRADGYNGVGESGCRYTQDPTTDPLFTSCLRAINDSRLRYLRDFESLLATVYNGADIVYDRDHPLDSPFLAATKAFGQAIGVVTTGLAVAGLLFASAGTAAPELAALAGYLGAIGIGAEIIATGASCLKEGFASRECHKVAAQLAIDAVLYAAGTALDSQIDRIIERTGSVTAGVAGKAISLADSATPQLVVLEEKALEVQDSRVASFGFQAGSSILRYDLLDQSVRRLQHLYASNPDNIPTN
jgi:RHS repeat-associated protein